MRIMQVPQRSTFFNVREIVYFFIRFPKEMENCLYECIFSFEEYFILQKFFGVKEKKEQRSIPTLYVFVLRIL